MTLVTSCIVVLSLLAMINDKVDGLTLEIQVNGERSANGSTVRLQEYTEETISIRCYYDVTLKSSNPTLCDATNGRHVLDVEHSYDSTNYYIQYNVPHSEREERHRYVCQATSILVDVTLVYSKSDNGGNGSKESFTGLNPLIYTISAVILLGTLAIIAIITCWIRARRSFNNRMLRSNTTPQDYFDYINDNEFTPLTSSEFAASLQERPPTYIESERIEQSESEGNDNRDSNVENVIPHVPPPPQPHTLPSLTRLRVVQLENISSRAGEARSVQQSASESESSAASGGTETTDVNLIDLTEHQSSDDFPDDNPLYS